MCAYGRGTHGVSREYFGTSTYKILRRLGHRIENAPQFANQGETVNEYTQDAKAYE
jgi:hypothetical protein